MNNLFFHIIHIYALSSTQYQLLQNISTQEKSVKPVQTPMIIYNVWSGFAQ